LSVNLRLSLFWIIVSTDLTTFSWNLAKSVALCFQATVGFIDLFISFKVLSSSLEGVITNSHSGRDILIFLAISQTLSIPSLAKALTTEPLVNIASGANITSGFSAINIWVSSITSNTHSKAPVAHHSAYFWSILSNESFI
jgi:hypothetical protein